MQMRRKDLTRSKRGRWRSWRRWTRAAAFLFFLTLVLSLPPLIGRSSLTKSIMLFDPLVTFSTALGQRALPPLWFWALVFILLTLMLGRVWCGWLCPVGTLLDVISLRRFRLFRSLWREKLRMIKYVLFLVVIGLALAGNLTFLVLDPLTMLGRAITGAIWPWLDHSVMFLEDSLYPIPALSDWVIRFDTLLRPQFFAQAPTQNLHGGWLLLPLLVVIGLNLFAERGWCRSVCPLGGMLGLLARFSWLQRSVSSDCLDCGLCAKVCPTGTINPDRGHQSDPGECTLCMLCLDDCPANGNSIRFGKHQAFQSDYDLGRRQAISTLGLAFLGGVGLWFDATRQDPAEAVLRPPGSTGRGMLAACVRCGLCLQACPTGALQPVMSAEEVGGFWTPGLVPRVGYCDYSCNACGQICPVGAISPLNLYEKRDAVIGLAVLDQDRCLAWAENTACIVCEEMCPLPQKAIALEDALKGEGEVQRPIVLEEQCIGCGICEYKCPLEGEAAIRIHPRVNGKNDILYSGLFRQAG